LAALLALAAATFPGPARAAGWVATPAVQPPLATGEVLAVSCPTTTFCAALGDDANGGLAMNRSGGAWILVPAPWPDGRPASHLAIGCLSHCETITSPISLSCISPAFCLALTVGQGALAPAVWDGRSWSSGAVPAPIGEPGETLTAVTCRSRTFCLVVGSMRRRGGRTVELAERWNGSRWRVQRLPPAAGVRASRLWGVSCTGPRFCVTVGTAVPARSTTRGVSPTLGVADNWNGHSWTSESLGRQPAGSGLLDVSCSSPRACLAVGFGGAGHTPAEPGPLTERFDGRRWRVLAGAAVVDTGGFGSSALTAVSCPGARTCIAVGSFAWANGGDGYYTGSIEERWDGVRWHSEVESDAGGGHDLVLNSASCAGPAACTIVGTDTGNGGCYTLACGPVATFASGWNGRVWSVQATPGAGTPSSVMLTSGSCAGPAACVVVGTMTEANGDQTVVSEAWNGSGWSVQPLPGLTEPLIGCDGTGRCLLMGTGSAAMAGLLNWDGSRWGPVAVAPPPILGGAVTCDPGDPCLAVGLTTAGFNETGLLWDGTTWTPTALDPPANARADAASCAPTTATCAVVGDGGGNGNGPNRWTDVSTGGGWASQLVSGPGEFTRVSCPTANFCLTTGSTYSQPPPGQNPVQIPIAEDWNGSAWAPALTPDVIPTAVACVSATSCQAVAAGSGDVDVYNGQSWTEQPAAPNTKSLTDISCHADGSCVAVGALTDGTPVMERNP
jgi:hypothetical protein